MTKRMLIDSSHAEETRVVIMEDNTLLEYDSELSGQRTLKGNIYLAKITRVEPSLQAAFVDYGGNRHGFLPFSEIHPDYFRIPVADREALLAEQARGRYSRDDEDADDDDDDDLDTVDDGGVDELDDDEDEQEPLEEAGGAVGSLDDDDDEGEDGSEPSDGQSESDGPSAGDADDSVRTDTPSAPLAANPIEPVAFADAEPAQAPPFEAGSEPSADGEEVASHANGGDATEPAAQAEPDGTAEATETGDPTASDDDNDGAGDDAQAADGNSDTGPDDDDPEDPDQDASDDDASVDDAERRPRRGRGRGRTGGRTNGRTQGRGRRNGGSERTDEDRRRSAKLRRDYTIQEVIKRGQIMLVQVVKEERGTKGAAVTSYLSLAGRYCVLMPNTARGGGISRKITVASDRKRLKGIVESLEIPGGMAVIVRTAGIGRTKPEIKRDFDYLAKTWEQIREVTLQSRAPALIYEESQLIKRVLRDSYSREIEEILVQGESAYREAKDFMKTLMPSHAKRVQPYRESSPPLFHRFQVDAQLEHLHSPIVQLRSGGYLVINLTEALVAIDINSGRSTRERNIEETAFKTNLEAAEEIARQLRLRDLAGLIVIDFIDMEDRRNNAAVERKLKDSLRGDRARVQVGRISQLGLLEMSRQRLRTSLLETMMQVCPHCNGVGRIHSTATSALHVLRVIEDHGMRGNAGLARVAVAPDVAFYILNDKRDELARLEADYKLACRFEPDASLIAPELRIDMLERVTAPERVVAPLPPPLPLEDAADFEDEVEVEVEEDAKPQRRGRRNGRSSEPETEAEGNEGRRGRRGGRRRRRDEDESNPGDASGPIAPPTGSEDLNLTDAGDDMDEGARGRGRRRRRRRTRPDVKPLPGVAVFARSPTPLAFHVAAEEQKPAERPERPERPKSKRRGKSKPAAALQDEAQNATEDLTAAAEANGSAVNNAVTGENAPAPETIAEVSPTASDSATLQPEAEQEPTQEPDAISDSVAIDPAAEIAPYADAVPEPEAEPSAVADEAQPAEPDASAAPEPEQESAPEPVPEPAMTAPPTPAPEPKPRPTRRGWWNRLLS